ncbi:MAG: intein-containing elongation factor EF-2, partial [Nanoarchaeota archaeon]|nr:intein-containing elongation factor EF-2 [Nanoarchaeota archaeon]
MAVDMTAKVKELQNDPTHIRNIAICAHIDHGKCISGDSKIQLVDGSLVSAKELYDISLEGRRVHEDEEKVIYDVTDLGLEVFSLNKDEKKLEKKKISHTWKLKGGEVIKLGLRNGYGIKTTPEHRYVVFEDFEFKDREAGELKIGDRVICPR